MPPKEYKNILLESEKNQATVRLNRPQQGNTFGEEMCLELLEVLHHLAAPSVRSVVLTGEGADFCVGLDPEFLQANSDTAPQLFHKIIGYLNQAILELRRLAKPVVAAVNGKAHGTGFSLCLACDFILASQGAAFSSSGINMGLSPDGGLSYFLSRLIGPQKCAELVMTGKTISARKAQEMGIVTGVVAPERLMEEAKSLAVYFAHGPTLALGKVKRLIDASLCHSLEEQLEEERQALMDLGSSYDFKVGLEAQSGEKKKPLFKGV